VKDIKRLFTYVDGLVYWVFILDFAQTTIDLDDTSQVSLFDKVCAVSILPDTSWFTQYRCVQQKIKNISLLYHKLVSLQKNKIMARNTSILLGDYFENFISEQIALGKYSSVSEVIRAALRCFEQEENKAMILVKELKKGEESDKIQNFDRKEHLKRLHVKYVK
jgi:putative addiction module antidote protein, CC2985 family